MSFRREIRTDVCWSWAGKELRLLSSAMQLLAGFCRMEMKSLSLVCIHRLLFCAFVFHLFKYYTK